MPIEVHCPNPECAQVHQVKDKYAGMRGKCPACSSWMYIPKPAAPVVEVVSPEVEVPAEAPRNLSRPAGAGRAAIERTPGSGSVEKQAPVSVVVHEDRARRARVATVEEDADESPVDVKPDAEKPRRKFSWSAAALLVLAMLSFGAIAVTPFLDIGRVNATGYFKPVYEQRTFRALKQDQEQYVIAAPSVGAALVFLALVAGIVARRFAFLSVFLVYLSALLAAALLLIATLAFRDQSNEVTKLVQQVAEAKQKGRAGDIDPTLGQYLWVGLGGAVGASLSLILAAVVMHRRWWSRVLGFLFLAGVTALGVVWVYRQELNIEGIDQYVPKLF
jgi:hypothetical protein